MTRATSRLSDHAREQALALQRRYPTFSEALQTMLWRLEHDPDSGALLPDSRSYQYHQDAGPGRPGVRIIYRYRPGEIEILAVDVID